MKTAIVTGSSSGIGMHTALALAKAGYATYGTMRDMAKAEPLRKAAQEGSLDIRIIRLDVDEPASVRAAVARVLEETGRIDVLVNNAGYGHFGALEEMPLSDFKNQFETNLFGVVATIQEVLPSMRAQKDGRIINVGSVAGRMGFPCSPAYVSSKFALEGLTECLRYELDPLGVQVTVIEPGVIKTSFFKSMKVTEPKNESYKRLMNHIMSGLQMMVQMGTEPGKVAEVILEAVRQPEMLPRYVVGPDAAMFLKSKNSKSDIEFERYMKREMFPGDA